MVEIWEYALRLCQIKQTLRNYKFRLHSKESQKLDVQISNTGYQTLYVIIQS